MKIKDKKIPYWIEEDGQVIHRLVYRLTWHHNLRLENVTTLLNETIKQWAADHGWQVHRFGISIAWIRVVVQIGPHIGVEQVLKSLLEVCEKNIAEKFPELAAESPMFFKFLIETPKIDQYSKLVNL